VQLFAEHTHPLPAIETSESPAGIASATVTGPIVGPALVAFETVTV
jgi:hypothetical protein